jgi:GDP-4-dehydro-6-deoxy-D-mannose reductase
MAAIEAGLMEPTIKVGNLETRRDFSHTADVARALWLLLDRGEAGEVYNLCSGEATRIGDIVELVREQGTVRTEIAVDPSRIRPSDEPILMGDNSKLKAATGWEPAISIEEIVAEILSYWRGRTGESVAAQRPPLKAVRAAQG